MARWKQKTHLLRPDEFVCSSCGAAYEKAYKDCPSCAAHMRNARYDPSWPVIPVINAVLFMLLTPTF